MTKKFLHKISYSNESMKNEFLIPDYLNKVNKFVGIETGIFHNYGLIVMTGINLNPDKLMTEIKFLKNLPFRQKKSVRGNIVNHLNQIKNIKIGNYVFLKEKQEIVSFKSKFLKTNFNGYNKGTRAKWGKSVIHLEIDPDFKILRKSELFENGNSTYSSIYKKKNRYEDLDNFEFNASYYNWEEITKYDFLKTIK